jgi:tRNA nucleotidyltransferase/poly(A) polymerase
VTARLPPGPLLSDPAVRAALALLDRDGEQARLVGGAVRNALLGEPPGDIDVATTALPAIVMDRAAAAGIRAVPTGVEHGTVTLVLDGRPVEVTTLREDVETDGRRAVVVFGRDFAHDARRRDFTMNALYARLDGTIEDHVGGLADLEARRVRFIGDPAQRIREDYLRILRLFRFHASYGRGPVDPAALHAAIALRDGLVRLSAERVRAELLKLLAARHAARTLPEVAEAGFLPLILGGVADVRAFAALAALGPVDPVQGLAALAVRIREDAVRLTERLRLSRAEADRLERAALVMEGFHGRLADCGSAALRRIAYARGIQAARDGLVVTAAREGTLPLDARLAAAAGVLDEPIPVSPFTGKRLLAAGLPAGPRIGAVAAAAEAEWMARGFPLAEDEVAAILEDALRAERG